MVEYVGANSSNCKNMTLTSTMLEPITNVITDNLALLVGVVITIASAGLLFKFIKRAVR